MLSNYKSSDGDIGYWEKRISWRGYPYWIWRKPMPRIEDEFLDSVLYVYPNEQAAAYGEKVGGCGFIASVKSEIFDRWEYFYAVTNKHVIVETGTPVLRINTTQNEFDILNTDSNDWELHPDGDDIAVLSLKLDIKKHKALTVDYPSFTIPETVTKYNLGPGDDTFMIGRFINHEGQQKNLPTARFGNIAMMPLERVLMPDGLKQEAFLVEMRSLPGYSGSPVFWEIPDLSRRPHSNQLKAMRYRGLLGIDAGHLPYEGKVVDVMGNPHPDKLKVILNSGMAVVIPAWKILELLDMDKFKKKRQENDALLKQILDKESAVELDSTTEDQKTNKDNSLGKGA